MIKFFKQLFSFNYNNNLEEYLKSKNVASAADVEYWIKQYQRSTKSAYF